MPSVSLSTLSLSEVGHRLACDGINLRVPPFVMNIRSSIPVVAQGVYALYGGHEWLEGRGHFADFHVAVSTRHRVFKKLCVFEMDGFQPFTPLAYGEAFAFLEWGMNWCITSHCHRLYRWHRQLL